MKELTNSDYDEPINDEQEDKMGKERGTRYIYDERGTRRSKKAGSLLGRLGGSALRRGNGASAASAKHLVSCRAFAHSAVPSSLLWSVQERYCYLRYQPLQPKGKKVEIPLCEKVCCSGMRVKTKRYLVRITPANEILLDFVEIEIEIVFAVTACVTDL